jgi:hypothetical protein
MVSVIFCVVERFFKRTLFELQLSAPLLVSTTSREKIKTQRQSDEKCFFTQKFGSEDHKVSLG